MRCVIVGGKGGVGKTTIATAYALAERQEGRRVAIIDFDGGHSVARTLEVSCLTPNQICRPLGDNLAIVVVEALPFRSLSSVKAAGGNLDVYLAQFPEDAGLVPWADLPNIFFGVPADVGLVQKYTVLVWALLELESQGYDLAVIDVEPTAGLERLLINAGQMAHSLRNLQKQSWVIRQALGAFWPDIRGYLDGQYIARADYFATRLELTAEKIKDSQFLLVCTPQSSPVAQMMDLWTIIARLGGVVRGVVVNGLRGRDGLIDGDEDEQAAIAPVKELSLSVAQICWSRGLQHEGDRRITRLINIGQEVASVCLPAVSGAPA